MPLQFQTASIQFGQGVDTKTDPKLVVPGKLLVLKDGVFTQGGQVIKRNGYDSVSLNIIGGGTLSNPKMLMGYGENMVCAAGGRLYEYSEALAGWRDTGKYDSYAITQLLVSGGNQVEKASTVAILNNYALVAYDSYIQVTDVGSNYYASRYSVIDLETNSFLASDQLLSAETSFGTSSVASRAILLGNSTLGVFYVRSSTLYLRIITITLGGGVNLGAELTMASDIQVYNAGVAAGEVPWWSYDVINTSTGCTLAYSDTLTNIKYKNIDTSGNITATGTLATVGNAIPLTLATDGSGNIWTYWAAPPTTGGYVPMASNTSVYYAIRSSSLSSVLGKTTIATNQAYVRNITAYSSAVNTQTYYFSTSTYPLSAADSLNNIGTVAYPILTVGTVNTSATVTVTSYIPNLDIYSKPFSFNSKTYLACMFYSPQQATGFILDCADNQVSAKFLPGVADGVYSSELTSIPGFGSYWWRYPGFLGTVASYGTKAVIPANKVVQDIFQGSAVSVGTVPTFITGTALVFMDSANADAYQGKIVGDSLILNGGILSLFDGSANTELGYHAYPDLQASAVTSGGALPDGVYGVQAVYQWCDALGNLYQSSPSPLTSVTVTGGSGSGSITVTAKTCSFSAKNNTQFHVQVQIYVTAKNGSLPYLNGQVQNSAGVVSIGYTVTSPGGNTAQPVYTNAGAVLENTAPPSSVVMMVSQNRLWAVDSENPENSLWYSKTFVPGSGVNFSDLLTLTIDTSLGSMTALAYMDEKTLILKQQGLMYFIGDGANDAGTGATYTVPQIVPSDVGAVNSRGVIVYPNGVIFKSPKGYYLINRGIQTNYIGAPVQAFNSQDCKAATLVNDKTQIRFLTSSGYSFVYDYYYDQWSQLSNHTGYSSDLWNGTYVYVRTDGAIYSENSSSYLDGSTAYSLYAQTAWIKASQIQNFQRAKLIELLGDFGGAAGHGIRVSAATDWSSSSTALTTYSFPSSSGVYQFRAFLPVQRCDALQITIQEVTTGASGEWVDLSDLGVEIGLKKGLNKLPAASSVG